MKIHRLSPLNSLVAFEAAAGHLLTGALVAFLGQGQTDQVVAFGSAGIAHAQVAGHSARDHEGQ